MFLTRNSFLTQQNIIKFMPIIILSLIITFLLTICMCLLFILLQFKVQLYPKGFFSGTTPVTLIQQQSETRSNNHLLSTSTTSYGSKLINSRDIWLHHLNRKVIGALNLSFNLATTNLEFSTYQLFI